MSYGQIVSGPRVSVEDNFTVGNAGQQVWQLVTWEGPFKIRYSAQELVFRGNIRGAEAGQRKVSEKSTSLVYDTRLDFLSRAKRCLSCQ
jgi:hypothetical protein